MCIEKLGWVCRAAAGRPSAICTDIDGPFPAEVVNTVSGKRLAAADRQRSQKYEYLLSTVFRWAIGLAVFAVILLNVFTHVLQLVHYNGRGMEPGLKNGQTLVLVKTQKVKDGDTIAFYYNNQVLVRRVIYL